MGPRPLCFFSQRKRESQGKAQVTARQISCENPKMCVPLPLEKSKDPVTHLSIIMAFSYYCSWSKDFTITTFKKVFIDVGFVVPSRLEPS